MAVRRAGRASQPGGATVAWSQAEGARGTRWREAITTADGLLRSVVLEASPDGRVTRLEVTTRIGMLTLHPEPDDSALHGNVVTGDGVRHLAFPWSPQHAILLLASPASATVDLARLATRLAIGDSTELDVVRIDDALEPRPQRWLFHRTGDREWSLQSLEGEEQRLVRLDPTGRPMLPDAVEWALEA